MADRDALVAALTIVTFTAGTTAPVESRTSPVISPNVCARRGIPNMAAWQRTKKSLFVIRDMHHSPRRCKPPFSFVLQTILDSETVTQAAAAVAAAAAAAQTIAFCRLRADQHGESQITNMKARARRQH